MNIFKQEMVKLKSSTTLRVMTVSSTYDKVENARGTAKFNGKTIVVKFDGQVWREV